MDNKQLQENIEKIITKRLPVLENLNLQDRSKDILKNQFKDDLQSLLPDTTSQCSTCWNVIKREEEDEYCCECWGKMDWVKEL